MFCQTREETTLRHFLHMTVVSMNLFDIISLSTIWVQYSVSALIPMEQEGAIRQISTWFKYLRMKNLLFENQLN